MHNDLGTTSIELIQSALSYVSAYDREVWVKVGMGIKAELGESGFDIWDQWSAQADNYSTRDARAVWKSFKAGGKVTIASLFGLAKEKGWEYKKPERRLSAAEIAARRAEAERRAAEAEAEKAAEHAAAAERALAVWNAAAPAGDDHPYLERKGVRAHDLRVGRWEIIDEETGEVRLITDNALLVKIRDNAGKIHSLQALFPGKIMGGRDKDYLKGGAKSGHFHAIGKPQMHDGRRLFILAEGYATAASIHECTGHLVLVCFDTSNLVSVARAIRQRQPDAIILFAADNDLWNRRPDGTPANPGIEAARKAAAEVGGLVAVPPFTEADQEGLDSRGRPTGPTDFNDLHLLRGADAVREAIEAGLNGQTEPPHTPEPEPEPEADEDLPPWEGEPDPRWGAEPQAVAAQPAAITHQPPPDSGEEELADLEANAHFTVLGYDGGTYYLFVHAKKQIMSLTKGDISDIGLLEYAPANWWEAYFPGQKGGIDRKAVAGWLFAVAHSRGIYDPERIRGRGAWDDKGRSVFHHGSYLTVDGVETQLTRITSAYVYPMARQLAEPAAEPLTAEDGRWLLKVAEMVRWSTEGSAALMAGWTMLAPICGALKWRPHIWITGPAGSGKSTVQRDYCVALLSGVAKYYQGDSSEPGIRQELRSDALPVLIDELESNNESERKRVEGIIGMVRKSSSETQAKTAKGTVSGEGIHFMVRSMFCLASINVNLPGKADIDRLTRLVIRPPAVGGETHWAALAEELHKISTDETISRRLLARALKMMPVIKETIAVFSKVAAAHFGTQRHGDQYGALLAGCWSLTHDTVPTAEEAAALITRYNWDEHTEDHDQDDATEALKALMNAKIRLGGAHGDVTVYELVCETTQDYRLGVVEEKAADAALRRHGIRVDLDKKVLLFGTSVPNLKALVKDSSCVTDIRGQLLRLDGAGRWNDKAVKFNGIASKCVAVPMGLVFDDELKTAYDDGFPL